jgi:hypothetical protein
MDMPCGLPKTALPQKAKLKSHDGEKTVVFD